MGFKILFVDDEPDLKDLILQKFRRQIRTQDLKINFSNNGVEALLKLQDEPDIDMVVTDINMPIMDGLSLLVKLSENYPLVKAVVVSAYSDLGNIRKAMNYGAFDFLTKPIDFRDLEITLNKTLHHVGELKESLRAQQEAEDKLRQSEAEAREKARELEQTLQHLQKTQTQLIQSEKMSLLGQLVAGVAHEINNPINFVHGNLIYINKYALELLNLIELYQQRYPQNDPEIQNYIEEIDLDFLIEDVPKMLSSMQIGTDRIRQIVLTLRNFSRVDEAEKKSVDLHEGIESTLIILQYRLKAKADRPVIEVIKEYGNIPPIECYAGQMNQVFMNILSNAIDAIEMGRALWNVECEERNFPTPCIWIHTDINCDRVRISIKDNGLGMTESVKSQIFDPFFTTKPIGKGTGLGLSISYQIVVDKHEGKLECFSQLGKGTEFLIEIPIGLTCQMALSFSSSAVGSG